MALLPEGKADGATNAAVRIDKPPPEAAKLDRRERIHRFPGERIFEQAFTERLAYEARDVGLDEDGLALVVETIRGDPEQACDELKFVVVFDNERQCVPQHVPGIAFSCYDCRCARLRQLTGALIPQDGRMPSESGRDCF